jgi:hypothetical protein
MTMHFADRVLVLGRHQGHARLATGLVEDHPILLHIGQPVVELGEDGRAEILAEVVSGAVLLVDPNLHEVTSLVRHPRQPTSEG